MIFFVVFLYSIIFTFLHDFSLPDAAVVVHLPFGYPLQVAVVTTSEVKIVGDVVGGRPLRLSAAIRHRRERVAQVAAGHALVIAYAGPWRSRRASTVAAEHRPSFPGH